ncbi:MAG TPA: hypothetical protein HA230_01940 [Candidatus Aenigmarchaeota archaeon]|nr:hypothetical protein [Candidatus Aenigmarchaeota archaeon]
MATLSVSVSDSMKEKMERMEEINWSAVARKAFEEKLEQVEFMRNIGNKSKLSKKDVEEISNKINRSVSKRFKEM